jgi:hypothetical protein
MKEQIAISILMDYSTTGAFAQDSEVNVDLPKRDGNLIHIYHHPPEIQVYSTRPTVRRFPDAQPDDDYVIRVGSSQPTHPGKTVIYLPPSESVPASAGNRKIGNFESNAPISGYRPANLAPGQSSRILPGINSAANASKAKQAVAQKPAAPSIAESVIRDSWSNTVLKYKSTESALPPGLGGSEQRTVRTSVTGKANFKPGDLIHAH